MPIITHKRYSYSFSGVAAWRTRLGWCVHFFLLTVSLAAQDRSRSVLVVNEEGGLPQNFVYSIEKDVRGLVWLGTGKGLSRFDGRATHNFFEEHGLADNFVTATKQHSGGALIVGHYVGSVSKFNGVYFTPLITDTLQSEIVSIQEDHTQTVWCAGKSGGLIKLNANLIDFEILYPGELRGKIVQDMILVSRQLIVATNEGLYCYLITPAGLIYKDSPLEVQSLEFLALATRTADTVRFWAATTGNTLCLLKAGTITTLEHKVMIPATEPITITSLAEDNKGHVWVGTLEAGIIRLELKNESEAHTIQFYNERTGYPITIVKKVIPDKDDEIWIGTLDQGLIKLFTPPVKTINLAKAGISEVNEIESRAGVFYLATNEGLYTYNGTSDETTDFRLIPELGREKIICVLPLPDSVVWVSTDKGNLIKLNQSTGKTETIFKSEMDEPIRARQMIADSNGTIWISAIGHGVYQFTQEGKVIRHLTTLSGFIHNDIYALYPDNKGAIWFGSHGAGLARLGPNDTLQLFSQSGLFPSHDVNDITGHAGQVWIATDGQGYFRYDGNTFQMFSQPDHPFIKGIEYVDGELWLSHRKGISMVSLTTNKSRNFIDSDGLDLTLTYASKFSGSPSYLIINNGNMITRIDKEASTIQPEFIPLLTEIKLFFTDILHPIPTPEEIVHHKFPMIELDHDKNHLTFHFTTITNKYRGPVYYRYSIREIDPAWSPATRETKVTYPALNPGHYTLQLQASIDAAIWSDKKFEYSFVINKPYWQTGWFYLALATLFVIVFGTIYSINISPSGKSLMVSILVLLCLFILFDYLQNSLEALSVNSAFRPVLKILSYLVFAVTLYPILLQLRKLFKNNPFVPPR